MKEFFGIGGYMREPEGYLSWQHLTFVTSLMIVMVALAIILGRKNRNAPQRRKDIPLIVSAFLINALEISKAVIACFRSEDPSRWIYELPLFLCSIQFFTIPLAAFTKGRLKDVCLDFVFIFGILGAVLGTYGAGNNYSYFPVISLDNVVSGLSHTTSGFCSLYIAISGMASMKRKNIPFCFGIVSAFCIVSYIVNVAIDYNYMFLMRGDGTPYDLIFNLVGGNAILYPIFVVLLFFVYIAAFNLVYNLAVSKKCRVKDCKECIEVTESKA
jgi:uncharacterized membrane protein YwaF